MTDISMPMYREFKHRPAKNCHLLCDVSMIGTQTTIVQSDIRKHVIRLPYRADISLPTNMPHV